MIQAVVLAALAVLGAALSKQLVDEFKAWTPWIIERIVRRAIRGLPEEYRERFGEEWRSHLSEVPGEIGKFFEALGYLRASARMSKSLLHDSRQSTDIARQWPDIAIGALLLAFCLPLLIIVASAITLTGGGPALRVRRLPRGGRTVRLYWFRTHATGADGKIRITPIGRALRRMDLELIANTVKRCSR